MTRQEAAAMLLNGQAGFEGQGYDDLAGGVDAFGADDPISNKGLSSLIIQLTIANAQQIGNAATGVDVFRQTDTDAAALPTGVASPAIAGYKTIIRYLLSNPSQIRSILIQSSETGSAPVLSSLQITPTRSSPFGMTYANALYAQSYQTTQDYQAGRITIPLTATLDGFSYLNFVSAVNASGATVTLNVTFLVGRRAEIRRNVSNAAPLTVRPGGRGPASVR